MHKKAGRRFTGEPFRLSIDFVSASALHGWFERIREAAGWRTVPVEGPKAPPGVPPEMDFSPQIPRRDVGIRLMDELDHKRVSADNQFIVSSVRGGGNLLSTSETVTAEPVLTAIPHKDQDDAKRIP